MSKKNDKKDDKKDEKKEEKLDTSKPYYQPVKPVDGFSVVNTGGTPDGSFYEKKD